MLRKVTFSFVKFMCWYSFFISSFVLGFYIMLHNDVGMTKASLNPIELLNNSVQFSESFQEFTHPVEAGVKTMAMYIGELDFSAMPIGIRKGMKHGNISYTLI